MLLKEVELATASSWYSLSGTNPLAKGTPKGEDLSKQGDFDANGRIRLAQPR